MSQKKQFVTVLICLFIYLFRSHIIPKMCVSRKKRKIVPPKSCVPDQFGISASEHLSFVSRHLFHPIRYHWVNVTSDTSIAKEVEHCKLCISSWNLSVGCANHHFLSNIWKTAMNPCSWSKCNAKVLADVRGGSESPDLPLVWDAPTCEFILLLEILTPVHPCSLFLHKEPAMECSTY